MSNPYPINPLLKYVVKVWMFFFTRKYKITASISDRTRNLNEPYLLLSNHYGRYDPFIVSYFLKKRPNFISSDAILRDRIIGTLFKGLGAMPKKKGVRDSYIIREMVKVVRAGGALALFPEGTRTWNGTTSHMDPSIAKLIKLLKIPVVTARMQGAYLLDPRWARPVRKARMEIEYQISLEKAEISELSEDEIFKKVWDGIYQDETEYQLKNRIQILSEERAEQLDLVLYQCSECKDYSGFTSKGNKIRCQACSKEFHLDEYGFIESGDNKAVTFSNLRDWINWQNANFVTDLKAKLKEGHSAELFQATLMDIQCAEGSGRMNKLGIGTVSFYLDRLEIKIDSKVTVLKLEDISSLGAQFKERVELFYGDLAYRFTSTTINEPGLKWELAANVIWANTNQKHKVSAYFSELVLD